MLGTRAPCWLAGHHAGVDRLQLSADGTQCVSWDTTGHDTSIYLWDIVKGKLSISVTRAPCWLLGHHAGADRLQLSADGTQCVSWDSTGHDTSIYLWHIVKGKFSKSVGSGGALIVLVLPCLGVTSS